MAAVRPNPAVRVRYRRVVAPHPDQKAIALGHAMRKLRHRAFAVGKSAPPFAAARSPGHPPAPGDEGSEAHTDGQGRAMPRSLNEPAVGLTPDGPATPAVTAAGSLANPPARPGRPQPPAGRALDFAHLKKQLPMARVLDPLGRRRRGTGPQRRGPCPIHRGDRRGRPFSAHLPDNVFQCFAANGAAKGDLIDLWARVKGLPLRAAALDLVETFGLEPAPGTEKRNG